MLKLTATSHNPLGPSNLAKASNLMHRIHLRKVRLLIRVIVARNEEAVQPPLAEGERHLSSVYVQKIEIEINVNQLCGGPGSPAGP